MSTLESRSTSGLSATTRSDHRLIMFAVVASSGRAQMNNDPPRADGG
jgi:hypothetical protein